MGSSTYLCLPTFCMSSDGRSVNQTKNHFFFCSLLQCKPSRKAEMVIKENGDVHFLRTSEKQKKRIERRQVCSNFSGVHCNPKDLKEVSRAYLLQELIQKLKSYNIDCLGNLCQREQFLEALEAFNSKKPFHVRKFTEAFFHLLQRCVVENNKVEGNNIHDLLRRCGLHSTAYMGTCLIQMYASFGHLLKALHAFNDIDMPDVYSWNAIITASVKLGDSNLAIKLYNNSQKSGAELNTYIFVSILKACVQTSNLIQCRLVHSHVVRDGCAGDVFVGSALIDAYCKCCELSDAKLAFSRMPEQNVVTWSTLISGFSNLGNAEKALEAFDSMQKKNLEPNEVTFAGAFKACGMLSAALEAGQCVHSLILESKLEDNKVVSGAIVDMYVKHGNLRDAQSVFDKLSIIENMAMITLISGYARNGKPEEALQHFQAMLKKGLVPDMLTLAGILQVCSKVAAFNQGRLVHVLAVECGVEFDLPVGSALITLYAKGANLNDARRIFDRLPLRSIITWSAILSACAEYSNFELAVEYYKSMEHVGASPNAVTYSHLISACNIAGLLDEACHFFKLMVEEGFFPSDVHYQRMAELFCRTHLFEEAEDMLECTSAQLGVMPFTSVLFFCYIESKAEVGRRFFDYIVAKGINDMARVLMQKTYAQVGLQEEAERVRELRVAPVYNEDSKSYIEVDNLIHVLKQTDMQPTQREKMLAELQTWSICTVPDVDPSFMSVLDVKKVGDKQDTFCGHTEMLAIVLGLTKIPSDATIRIAKNVRMCSACHHAAKTVSKVYMREIVVGDVCQVHHFKDGACRCKDERLLI